MKLIDVDPASRTNRFRERRMRLFLSILDRVAPDANPARILDVGGEPSYWLTFNDLLAHRRVEITLLNLRKFDVKDDRFRSVVGNATNLSDLEGQQFDFVHSNSVIEHVGRWSDMKMMAEGIARISSNFFVQTPNFWFPIEPHFRLPVFHWLPDPVRLRIVMSRSNGFFPSAMTIDEGMGMIESAILLTAAQLQSLFPDAEIMRERFGPFTKSLIAVSQKAPLSYNRFPPCCP